MDNIKTILPAEKPKKETDLTPDRDPSVDKRRERQDSRLQIDPEDTFAINEAKDNQVQINDDANPSNQIDKDTDLEKPFPSATNPASSRPARQPKKTVDIF